jgi:PadR family transcriptional regulator PadR
VGRRWIGRNTAGGLWCRRISKRPLDSGQISSYSLGMRRRAGDLVPLEVAVLAGGLELRRAGEPEFHGFQLAKTLRDAEQARGLTSHGTLYKALDRMEKMDLLVSRWEDPETAAADGRPRRRLYRVTGNGERALDRARETALARSAGRELA